MTTRSAAALCRYICAMMDAFEPASPAGRKLSEWLKDNRDVVGIDYDAVLRPAGRATSRAVRRFTDRPLSRAAWTRLRTCVEVIASAGSGRDAFAENVAALVQSLGLDGDERALFAFVAHCERDHGFRGLCAALVAIQRADSLGVAAIAVRRSPADLWPLLCRGPIRALDLIECDDQRPGRFALSVPYRIIRALLPPNDGLSDIEQRLIGPLQTGILSPEDFEHIARESQFLVRLLRGALATRRRGVNILLHGAPGTGKTEFCKMIAAQLSCNLFAVGEADEDGNEPLRSERIDALRLADKLAARRGKALLLFDEMEDILQNGDRVLGSLHSGRRAGSKVFFNRILEQNAVPVLWTANAIDEFDPAFLRRMTFALEMRLPPARVRARLWSGLARNAGLELPEHEATRLAQRHLVAPSLMTSAVNAVTTAAGTTDDLNFVMTTLTRPARQHTGDGERPALELLNVDSDLASLERALTRPRAARDFSLCLYGPPGTGKSAYARHLAALMGLDALVKRGSDLLSKYVGETEQNIAAAFHEARQDERFLVIDEAEGFLWRRGEASRSWEVSMVNELLVAMEEHRLPFACTTNHIDVIDPAALRRFTFKVKFDFMTAAQTAQAYARFFERAPPAALHDLQGLTPGDFAAVARKRRVLGPGQDDAALLRLLEQELAVKKLPARRIGF